MSVDLVGGDADAAGGVRGLDGVVQEVDEGALHLLAVDPDGGETRVHLGSDLHAGFQVLVEVDGLAHQPVEVHGRRPGTGHAGVAGEFVHHSLERHDLADDDLHPLLDGLAQPRVPQAVLAQQPLGGEADGGERVLDLVGDAPRGLVPGRELLRLDQLRQVLDHQHLALHCPCRVPQGGHLHLEGLPLAAQGEVDLFAGPPLGRPLAGLPHHRCQPRPFAISPGLVDRASHHLFLALAQHDEGRAVAGEDAAVRVDGDDAGRDVVQHGRDQRPLRRQPLVAGRQLAVAALQGLLVAGQLLGHAVEGVDQHAELVVRLHVHPVGEVAAADDARALGQGLDGHRHPAGEVEAGPRRGEEDDQGHHQEQQHVARPQVVLLHLELAVGLVVLHQLLPLRREDGIEQRAGDDDRRRPHLRPLRLGGGDGWQGGRP